MIVMICGNPRMKQTNYEKPIFGMFLVLMHKNCHQWMQIPLKIRDTREGLGSRDLRQGAICQMLGGTAKVTSSWDVHSQYVPIPGFEITKFLQPGFRNPAVISDTVFEII